MRCAFALGLAALAAGCSIPLDDPGLYVAPGKFDFLNCPDLAARSQRALERETELSALMQRASADPGGRLVNTLVYQDELNSVRAEQRALQKAADDKRCALAPPSLTPLR
ncbi:MAG TPA: hypothetical protein VIH40_04720 [Xanthobacteraceae bacterium]